MHSHACSLHSSSMTYTCTCAFAITWARMAHVHACARKHVHTCVFVHTYARARRVRPHTHKCIHTYIHNTHTYRKSTAATWRCSAFILRLCLPLQTLRAGFWQAGRALPIQMVQMKMVKLKMINLTAAKMIESRSTWSRFACSRSRAYVTVCINVSTIFFVHKYQNTFICGCCKSRGTRDVSSESVHVCMHVT